MKRLFVAVAGCLCLGAYQAQSQSLNVNWDDVVSVSKSTPTLQVVGNPMLRRKAAMHDASFAALKQLNADYVRYVPWFPYPKLAVAELEPPAEKTSWDFSLIDPMTIDFLENTKGHSVILNFSTIPQWMFKTDNPVTYPADANQVSWGYSGGTVLRDTSMKELTGYYVRLISWYSKGGFTDELGKYHKSGHHYEIPYWEVLNEPDLEHSMSPQTYTKIYDAMVTAIKTVSPRTKFVGMALAYEKPDWFEYFLDPANHKPGIPLDMISYHCYANANSNQKFEAYEYSVFDKAESFINSVNYIENIRKRLSPGTKTDINELGTFVSDEMRNQPITPAYWNLSASVYAYFFIELSKRGIDVIGESQLVGFPTQFPDVSMINYINNKPNARFWVLKMIKDNIKAGSKLVRTGLDGNNGDNILAQGFVNGDVKKVLILNKRNKGIFIKLPATFKGAKVSTIDGDSGDSPATRSVINNENIEMKPFAVKLIELKK
ncbi:glycosyl hydrolase family 39 [Mucilaginibacter sp. UR6-11]|uniref:GH39 family glycosyl hydrolase n=1 Tax=Mucilaginibacter sp. UR6-11 TaxID=1435644 RepID=UPI001E4248D9|nr:glycosyl hydrolase family 39 [Mucilaginibacter sp. UR6-11]MCC8423741.1 glycosyl hydrolase family 39 [Mucilaginibacter sp. UR6-11]